MKTPQFEVQTEMASGQTVPDRSYLWSDRTRLLSSDQTIVRSQLRVRLKYARSPNLIRLEWALDSASDQTDVR